MPSGGARIGAGRHAYAENWDKSLNCFDSYHDECLGCACVHPTHKLGGHGGKRQVVSCLAMDKTAGMAPRQRPNPTLHVEQVWNPYDSRWERLE